ncbi:site-specific integrase [Halobellus ordinarius]|uniref:site-specific integrase n=1 Tax=Halobellus ordinarius TaxID=3075120 RepID=UPI0028806806|nr:site-specific integrase [Halobellus sp. ZY16]
MKYRPLDNGSWRVHFDTAEYNILLDSAPHRRARIAERVMAHSPRVGTVSGIALNQFSKIQTPHGPIWLLHVEAKDTTNRDGSLLPREVWICEPLIREIEDFTGVEDLDAHNEPTPLFRESKRTIQNWVTETAENAGTKTGDEDFLKISSHDFRRYFASHMLYRHGVDPEIVRQLGGWQSPKSMKEYLLLPNDVLAEELGEVGLLGAEADRRPARGTPYREGLALRTLAAEIEESGHEDQKRLAEDMAELFDDVNDVDVAVAGSAGAAERAASTMADNAQSSFMQIDELHSDESGTIDPTTVVKTAKGMYLTALFGVSWTISFGPIF